MEVPIFEINRYIYICMYKKNYNSVVISIFQFKNFFIEAQLCVRIHFVSGNLCCIQVSLLRYIMVGADSSLEKINNPRSFMHLEREQKIQSNSGRASFLHLSERIASVSQ